MKYFLRKLAFILRYDFDFVYIVYDFENQSAMSFLNYADAEKFSDSQLKYRPQVMVGVTKDRNTI